jgi:hypothetical protein
MYVCPLPRATPDCPDRSRPATTSSAVEFKSNLGCACCPSRSSLRPAYPSQAFNAKSRLTSALRLLTAGRRSMTKRRRLQGLFGSRQLREVGQRISDDEIGLGAVFDDADLARRVHQQFAGVFGAPGEHIRGLESAPARLEQHTRKGEAGTQKVPFFTSGSRHHRWRKWATLPPLPKRRDRATP